MKYLPKKIRGQIGLLYLLARIADTIADSKTGETEVLIDLITKYNDVAQGNSKELPEFSELSKIQENPAEAKLLLNVQPVVDALEVYSKEDQQRMLECLDIIIAGQVLDLQRFGIAKEGGTISSLDTEDELDDYTFRVAGCVGVFWTKMSLAHMFKPTNNNEDFFMAQGIRFGKALQMINIMRDIPEDLRFGRCYVPSPSLENIGLTPESLLQKDSIQTFRPLYDSYLDITDAHLDAAIEYILMIPGIQFRSRAACMLPVLVGQRTVSLLRKGNPLDSERVIKVTRDEMKSYFKKILKAMLVPGGVKRLLMKNKSL